jgi:drug/metabolite transporter (DMT)-like permease
VPASAFALALGAAVLHATWNALLARSQDVRAATTVALVVGVLLFAPLAAGGTASLRRAASPSALLAGVLSFGAYALALGALEIAPAASVAAVRETSILFAVGLGAIVLRERVNAGRVAGAALVVVGVALVALA